LNSTAKTLLFWILILVTSVLLYSLVQQTGRASSAPKAVRATNIQYQVVPVKAAVPDIRLALETASNNGWELVAPVVENGTTTALIFKYEKK
jgi:hypothetical protein